MRYLLGIDLGSSSVKVALLEADTGLTVAQGSAPTTEMAIQTPEKGWAEQDPELWWQELKHALENLRRKLNFDAKDIMAIGIGYQMHGLVLIDAAHRVLRPSIIWCDSRAVPYGMAVAEELGNIYCQEHLLNQPGNFTAAKLAWVKAQEPALYEQIYKVLLPGDFMALRLTGVARTTASGLSEGIFWDFKTHNVSEPLLKAFGFSADVLPELVPTFGIQGYVTAQAAAYLGLAPGIPVSYRAGDQPNNAFSLNVLNAGEVAANAGTSGVVYGLSSYIKGDADSRINAFLHVNHTTELPRIGLLLCINGTGILNNWVRQHLGHSLDYDQMTALAQTTPIGAEGLAILPFGNGAERLFKNQNTGAVIDGLHFGKHTSAHMFRAAQEGIVYALAEGLSVMTALGQPISTVRAGAANLFLSPLFREAFANTTDTVIELYDTDGAIGAARAAGIGVGHYATATEALSSLQRLLAVEPRQPLKAAYTEGYLRWKEVLKGKGLDL